MKDYLSIEGEGACIKVHAPGFIVEVRRSSNKVIPLSHHGRNAVNVATLEYTDDVQPLCDALRALPESWLMSFTGIEAPLAVVAMKVRSLLEKQGQTVELHTSAFAPNIEAAITNASGDMVVLFQTSNHEGLSASMRNPRHISVHVAKSQHIGVVFGAIRSYCFGSELTTYFNDPLVGQEVSRWDMSRTDQVRAFLEEFEPNLDDFTYCRDAGLLQFCRIDVSKLEIKNNPGF